MCCAVSSDSGTAQHTVDSCNGVNWIQKIVFHLTCHGQVEPLTVVIKCRPFTLVEKKCDVAVSTVCLFVCLFYLTNPLCLQTLYRCSRKVKGFVVSLNDLLIDCFFTDLTHKMSIMYI